MAFYSTVRLLPHFTFLGWHHIVIATERSSKKLPAHPPPALIVATSPGGEWLFLIAQQVFFIFFSHPIQYGSSNRSQIMRLVHHFILKESQILCKIFKSLCDLVPHKFLDFIIHSSCLALLIQAHWCPDSSLNIPKWGSSPNSSTSGTSPNWHSCVNFSLRSTHQLGQKFSLHVTPPFLFKCWLHYLLPVRPWASSWPPHLNFHIYKMDVKIVSLLWGL